MSSGTPVPTGATGPSTINPVPASKAQFYFAGDQNTSTEQSTLSLLNPTGETAYVQVTFYFGDGTTGTARTTVNPNALARVPVAGLLRGAGLAPRLAVRASARPRGSFGLRVTADQPIVAALLFARPGRDGGAVLGRARLSRTAYLAEGYTGLTFHETVTVLNPDTRSAAHVTLRLLPAKGGHGRDVPLRVPAHDQASVDVNSLLPRQALGVVADADRPVLVGRTLTFSRDSHGTGYSQTTQAATDSASTRWLFAEGSTANGFQTFLTVLNPQDRPARVTATFFGPTGARLGRATLTVGARGRATIAVQQVVRATSFASVVTSDRQVVVERAEYVGLPNAPRIAGSDVFGRTGPASRWSFPDGDTTGGASEFLLLYNPAPRALPVDITFYGANGRTLTRRVSVAAGARYTLDVRRIRELAGLHAAVLRSTNGQGFVAEQTIFGPHHRTLRSTQGYAP